MCVNVGGRVALQCDRGIDRCRMSKIYSGACDDDVNDMFALRTNGRTGVRPSHTAVMSNGKKIDKINWKK